MKKELIVFLSITFGLTFTLNGLGYFNFGRIDTGANPLWVNYLSLQMLFPALASLLTMVLFKKPFPPGTRIIWTFFLAITFWSLIKLFYDPVLFTESQVNVTASMVGIQALSFIGALVILALNLKKRWRDQLADQKLWLGTSKYNYFISLLLLLIVLVPGIFLNYFFGLGPAAITFSPTTFFLVSLSVIGLAILSSWPYFLGEEYGWRIFLQERLFALFGAKKGVWLLGIVWGLWHAPVIALGYNYPGYPVLGILFMTLFTTLIGIILSWSVQKTHSVWPAVWLHLVNNNIISLGYAYISKPNNIIFSFGIGLYGLILLGLVGIILLNGQKSFSD